MNSNGNLKKAMPPGAVWALAVGSIIGFGCFIQGGNWTFMAGGPLTLVCGFLLGGCLMTIVGLNYAYMIPKVPLAGGEFTYACKFFGKNAGFCCGWMLLLGYAALVAMNATAVPILVSYLFPKLLRVGYLYSVAGYEVYAGEVAFAIVIIVLFGVLNISGVKYMGNTQLIMAILLCITVITVLIGTCVGGEASLDNLYPLYGADGVSFMEGLLSIVALSPFLFVGFDTIPQAAEEYNFSPKKCKILILAAIFVGAAIYIIVAMVTDVVVPWEDLKTLTNESGEKVAWITGAMVEKSMGKIGVIIITLAICMAIGTGINGFYLASSRLMFGMSREDMLPKVYSRVSERSGVPSACIIFVMIGCCICPFFGRNVLGWVIDMCSVGTAVGFFFTCASAYKLVKKDKEEKKGFSPILAILGCVISASVVLLLVVPISPARMSVQSHIALFIWVVLGVFFWITVKKKKG